MSYRPLSQRGEVDGVFDTLHEGIPPWLREPVEAWLTPHLRSWDGANWGWDADWLRTLQVRMRLTPPLSWTYGADTAANDLLGRARKYEDFGVDVLDYVLRFQREWDAQRAQANAKELAALLEEGGSAWEVTRLPDSRDSAITRRSLGPVREAIEELATSSGRAGAHLQEAWVHLAGRNPVPDQAYFHAVLAVEASAKPVVSPKDSKATLGKILRTMEAKPDKWAFTLGDPAVVVAMGDALWKVHRRHGTDDREAPLGMSQDEADAAVHIALTLVRWFTAGFVRAAGAERTP